MNIKFTFSYQFERALSPKGDSVSYAEIQRKIKMLEKFWSGNKKQVEVAFKKHTDLSFRDESVTCYLNTKTSFSDPLTIRIEENADMKDTLIHELIHVLLTQNDGAYDDGWKSLMEKYGNEEFVTRVHIAVHAIHLMVARDVFPKRVKRITSYSSDPLYRKSWDFVFTETPERILKTIFNQN